VNRPTDQRQDNDGVMTDTVRAEDTTVPPTSGDVTKRAPNNVPAAKQASSSTTDVVERTRASLGRTIAGSRLWFNFYKWLRRITVSTEFILVGGTVAITCYKIGTAVAAGKYDPAGFNWDLVCTVACVATFVASVLFFVSAVITGKQRAFEEKLYDARNMEAKLDAKPSAALAAEYREAAAELETDVDTL